MKQVSTLFWERPEKFSIPSPPKAGIQNRNQITKSKMDFLLVYAGTNSEIIQESAERRRIDAMAA